MAGSGQRKTCGLRTGTTRSGPEEEDTAELDADRGTSKTGEHQRADPERFAC